jgi:5-methyltetrahydropteroyltriglutamate--homocysteine methyltransferase
MPKKYRADQVGSFLRPQEVLDAHVAHREGRLSLQGLRAIEDRAILDCLAMQKASGIDVQSDGEFRRAGWSSDFADAVEGYVPGRPSVVLRFQGGQQAPSDGIGGQTLPSPGGGPAGGGPRVIGQRLVQTRRMTEHESQFLKAHATGPYKVTMPAASYIVARGYSKEVSDKVYGDRKGLLAAVASIINAEIKALMAEGCSYIQLDNPHYPDYIVDDRREQWRAIGVDPEQAMREDVEADNACLAGIDRNNLTVGMHFCRGNGGRGGWHTEGGYDRIAETVFGGLDYDTFLLEYDSERAGTFEPLRYMPKAKTVVLGLVTTKSGELEPQELIERRIEEASKYVDLDNLTLSPQCGFASVMQGNPLTFDEQRRKLDLVVSTARKVWGNK